MKLLIDDARISNIKAIYDQYPIDGVTSNPTILTKCGKQPYEALLEIREFIGAEAELHVQVISETAVGMLEEAHQIVKILGSGTYVKIPVVPEGLKAIRQLSKEGIHVTATAIYTPMQAFLAGKAGADYAAPYVNRIDNLGANGIQAAKDIHDIFKMNGLKTQVLAASFKNSQQVLELCKYGVGASTVDPEVITGLIKNDAVRVAVDVFIQQFKDCFGEEKTMLNCN